MSAVRTAPASDVLLEAERLGTRRQLRPEDIGPMVETVLRAARERLDAEAAAARAEAASVVAAAVQRSTDLILSFDRGRGRAPRRDDAVDDLSAPEDDASTPEGDPSTAAQVYDLFWAETPSDQPIRERLRRWAQRPPL